MKFIKFSIIIFVLFAALSVISDKVLGEGVISSNLFYNLAIISIVIYPVLKIIRWAKAPDDKPGALLKPRGQSSSGEGKKRSSEASLPPTIISSDPDIVVFDIRPAGKHYWTYKYADRKFMSGGGGSSASGRCGKGITRTNTSYNGRPVVFSYSYN